jgi:hypothetical protein
MNANPSVIAAAGKADARLAIIEPKRVTGLVVSILNKGPGIENLLVTGVVTWLSSIK